MEKKNYVILSITLFVLITVIGLAITKEVIINQVTARPVEVWTTSRVVFLGSEIMTETGDTRYKIYDIDRDEYRHYHSTSVYHPRDTVIIKYKELRFIMNGKVFIMDEHMNICYTCKKGWW